MTTPDNITSLPENSVFVFGSNATGAHAGGAARTAHEKFGYPMGKSTGLIGQAYGIDTMGSTICMLRDITYFLETAKSLPAITFYLTKVACGIAGRDESEVMPLFADAPSNVIKPEGWR